MNENSLNRGRLEQNSVGIGEISDDMVTHRAIELAYIANRIVNATDRDQALRELIGGSELDANEEQLASASEDQRWEPVPGSIGHQTQVPENEDEDENGLSQGALLVAEGVSEAAHDQMLQAAKAAKKEALGNQ
jgi:hypothetical protein